MLPRALVAIVVLAACGGGPAAHHDDGTERALRAATARCPVAELDVAIDVADRPDGAIITFTTVGQPDRLRGRVFELADQHNDVHSEMGPLPEERPDGAAPVQVVASPGETTHAAALPAAGAPLDSGVTAMLTVHSRARAEEIGGGARIVFIARADDVEELRDELRERASEIARECEIR